MRAFLDFEASSLADASYPIEVGWVFEDGRAETHLIRPAPAWTDWDRDAERIHGISRTTLETQGTAHEVVAQRMLATLSDHDVYASAPSWDGKWLSVLLRAAGLPRHAMRLKTTAEAKLAVALEALAPVAPEDQAEALARALITKAEAEWRGRRPGHRALADARQELADWMEIRRRAEGEARRLAGGGTCGGVEAGPQLWRP